MKTVRSVVSARPRWRNALIVLAACATVLVSGCSTLSTWLPSWLTAPSLPSLPWFQSGPKVGPLPAFDAKATAQLNWQVSLGGSGGAGFAPAVLSDAVYAASTDGTLVSVDPATGAQRWRSNTGKPLSAGVGAAASVLVVGTNKGDVLAFDASGKPLWQVKVPSEVSGPPKLATGTVIVWSLDGKIFGLSAADGSLKWV
jgi:outer membrane protein assembly factor BamB